MSKNLLIVESPNKIKSIKKYLGQDFEVLASFGHVRDLVPKSGAVDTDNDFAMKYQIISKNSKHVDAIVAAAKNAEHIYLATDPDREGEAISWHIAQILQSKRGLKGVADKIERVVFHEVTQKGIQAALKQPRQLDLHLVDAQQARRALDYLVGFNLSPLLWKKIRRGLSAGRVQSPALRLICERENEIRAFEQQEYWTIHLDSHKSRTPFSAKLIQWQNQKLEQLSLPNQESQETVLMALQGKTAQVANIIKKKATRKAAAPYTTSTMQQDAVRKLSFTTDRTMRTAQQLFEGIDVGQGAVGLITYMRTDSVTLAEDALTEIRHFIANKIGEDYLPSAAKRYKTKSKNAQEAHEAIRPTSVYRTPESVKPFLSPDQFKLYQMIWQRTVACQMVEAKFDATTVDIQMGDGVFRASGQVLVFDGFLRVYQEGLDEENDDSEQNKKLPEMKEGETLPINKLYSEQHFTQPPARFNEATLVKALEEYGIGRPSTYASIIKTLKDREYVVVDQRRFLPTDTGEVVNKFLTEHFHDYVDYTFTAKLEDDLDRIANGEKTWIPVMEKFWKGFSKQVSEKEGIERAKLTTETLEEMCPQCSEHHLQVKFGRAGRFIACGGYPKCNYTRNINETAEEAVIRLAKRASLEGKQCPECGGQLVYKQSRFGNQFIGCANYPKCKYIESNREDSAKSDTGIVCPQCGKGHLVEKKSRFGTVFYSCNAYPDCKYAINHPPLNEPCPSCGWKITMKKVTKRWGVERVCPQKECAWKEQLEPPLPKEK